MSSSNPFRRKTNAQPQSELPAHPPGAGITQPLSINTATRAEKHVRIASPPDTTISPASYPSSPEFARLTPSPQQTIIPHTFNAGFQTPAANPLDVGDSPGEEDNEGTSEALKNTRLNIASTRVPAPQRATGADNAVQNTLSKFASRPRGRHLAAALIAANEPSQDVKRQTMNVDAFTRLLLTGGNSTGNSSPAQVNNIGPSNALSESSSTADSASISHQSIFEPLPLITADSPRTSHELDDTESVGTRRAITARPTSGNAQKAPSIAPPAPKPRHGKPFKAAQLPSPGPSVEESSLHAASPGTTGLESNLNKPLPPPPASITDISRRSSSTSITTDPSTQIKRPPTPPLSRRRSQGPSKPPPSRSSPSIPSPGGISQSTSTSSLVQGTKPPPPPPSRRTSQRIGSRTDSPGLPYTSEEPEVIDLIQPIMPQLSRTTSTATRTSALSYENVAPVPPPPRRRNRGSSGASQRPIIDVPGTSAVAGSGRSSIEGQRPELDKTGKASTGLSRDILKDLANLQAEVDALRRQGLRDI